MDIQRILSLLPLDRNAYNPPPPNQNVDQRDVLYIFNHPGDAMLPYNFLNKVNDQSIMALILLCVILKSDVSSESQRQQRDIFSKKAFLFTNSHAIAMFATFVAQQWE